MNSTTFSVRVLQRVVIAAAFGCTVVHAYMIARLTLDELVAASELIVRAKVTLVKERCEDCAPAGAPTPSLATLRVIKTYKGEPVARDDQMIELVHEPQIWDLKLNSGDEAVIFLKRSARRYSLAQGFYSFHRINGTRIDTKGIVDFPKQKSTADFERLLEREVKR